MATVHEATQSRTWLSDFHIHFLSFMWDLENSTDEPIYREEMEMQT